MTDNRVTGTSVNNTSRLGRSWQRITYQQWMEAPSDMWVQTWEVIPGWFTAAVPIVGQLQGWWRLTELSVWSPSPKHAQSSFPMLSSVVQCGRSSRFRCKQQAPREGLVPRTQRPPPPVSAYVDAFHFESHSHFQTRSSHTHNSCWVLGRTRWPMQNLNG